jgi:hypothetical protein
MSGNWKEGKSKTFERDDGVSASTKTITRVSPAAFFQRKCDQIHRLACVRSILASNHTLSFLALSLFLFFFSSQGRRRSEFVAANNNFCRTLDSTLVKLNFSH